MEYIIIEPSEKHLSLMQYVSYRNELQDISDTNTLNNIVSRELSNTSILKNSIFNKEILNYISLKYVVNKGIETGNCPILHAIILGCPKLTQSLIDLGASTDFNYYGQNIEEWVINKIALLNSNEYLKLILEHEAYGFESIFKKVKEYNKYKIKMYSEILSILKNNN